MKRILAILLSAAMIFSLAACSPAAAPSDGAEQAASGSDSAAPSDGAEQAPAAGDSAAPSDGAEQTPAAGDAAAPSQAPEDAADIDYESVSMNVGAIKGPTGMGMALLMKRSDDGEAKNDYTFTIAAAPDELVGKVVSGELDIASVPTNVAALLNKKTDGGVKMIGINTLGVLYIMQNAPEGTTPISSIEELRGKTIYATGQGANPEYVLNYLLRAGGLEPGMDVTVEFVGAHDELVALAATGGAEFCMLPEPNVTVLAGKNPDMKVALDLTEQWEAATGGESALVMGCVIARSEFIAEHPQAVDMFLSEYAASVEYTQNDVKAAAELIAEYGLVGSAAIAENALPRCNITLIDGADMQPAIEGYYQALFDADPTSVGGAVPGEEFYYLG